MKTRKTKIVCTLGPACDAPGVLEKLIAAGLNVARLNLSHGTREEHAERIKQVRAISGEVAILADLQGPRIRTGRLKNGQIELKSGSKLILTSEDIEGDDKKIAVLPSGVISAAKIGEIILLVDGTIKLKVTGKQGGDIKCVVVEGGPLGEHKGVNLPATALELPSLTAKDKDDIDWAIDQQVDYLALSFVRQASDVVDLKKILLAKKADIPVIAKIEKGEAVKNLPAIIEAADAVMVARGDLGVELSLEKVPVIQKEIIETCQALEKPVIVATQMLESMVKEPAPTRAEVSDVANAIFDGTDAVMLSEETSIGSYPVEAVEMMAKIALEAESRMKFRPREIAADGNIDVAVAHAACVLAQVVKAGAIITFTETGSTSRRVSKHRPDIPVLGVVTNDRTLKRLALYFGVQPVKIGAFHDTDEMITKTEKAILSAGILKQNETVVITAGVPVNIPGTTNLIKVHRIGERKTV
jgi:pyruvate kinase